METMKGLAEKAFELGVKFNMKDDLREIKQEKLKVTFIFSLSLRWHACN